MKILPLFLVLVATVVTSNTNDAASERRRNSYSYNLYEIPTYVDQDDIEMSVLQGLRMWTKANSKLQFTRDKLGRDFVIRWEKSNPKHLGTQQGGDLTITLGSYSCKNEWHQFSTYTIADTVAHEVGHFLGLEHHVDESHLMYSAESDAQAPFNSFGYTIPRPNQEIVQWISTEGIEKKMSSLKKKMKVYEDQVDTLGVEIDQLEEKHDGLTKYLREQTLLKAIQDSISRLTMKTLYRDTPYNEFISGGKKWDREGDAKNQAKYVGEVSNGVPNGQGTIYFPEGDRYIGEFKAGRFGGIGTYIYAGGSRKSGEWKGGELNRVISDDNSLNNPLKTIYGVTWKQIARKFVLNAVELKNDIYIYIWESNQLRNESDEFPALINSKIRQYNALVDNPEVKDYFKKYNQYVSTLNCIAPSNSTD